jgi:hypothetical protein
MQTNNDLQNLARGVEQACYIVFLALPFFVYVFYRYRHLKYKTFLAILFPATAVLGYGLLCAAMWLKNAQGSLRGPEAAFVIVFGWLYLPVLVVFLYLPLFYCIDRIKKKSPKILNS